MSGKERQWQGMDREGRGVYVVTGETQMFDDQRPVCVFLAPSHYESSSTTFPLIR